MLYYIIAIPLVSIYCYVICGFRIKNKKAIRKNRKEGYFLQHGSILKDVDFDLLEKIFGEKIEKNKIVTLKEINPEISDTDVINAIKEEFLCKQN